VTPPQRSLTGQNFDPMSDQQVKDLARMFADYLEQELERTGRLVPGFAVAGFLRTLIIQVDGKPVGFVSADLKRFSVELVYVEPEYRGQGVATLALADMARSCPQPMVLKAPLSPGGEALAERLGLGRAESTPEQVVEREESIAEAEQMIRQQCRHKRTGDPRRVCRRCYRVGVRRYAERFVWGYAMGVRAFTGNR
jgi:GNAT superfamily N-acetyltransferase